MPGYYNVLDTVPCVLIMSEAGISFQGFELGLIISQRRNEYECEDITILSVAVVMSMLSCNRDQLEPSIISNKVSNGVEETYFPGG